MTEKSTDDAAPPRREEDGGARPPSNDAAAAKPQGKEGADARSSASDDGGAPKPDDGGNGGRADEKPSEEKAERCVGRNGGDGAASADPPPHKPATTARRPPPPKGAPPDADHAIDGSNGNPSRSGAVAPTMTPATSAPAPVPLSSTNLVLTPDLLLEIVLRKEAHRRAGEIAALAHASAAAGGNGGLVGSGLAGAGLAAGPYGPGLVAGHHPQVMIIDTSQVPSSAHHGMAAVSASPSASNASPRGGRKKIGYDSRRGDGEAGVTQGHPPRSPGTPGKRRKKKNKKKKKKSSNNAKNAESPKQNQKANSSSTQEAVEEKKSDSESAISFDAKTKGADSSESESVVALASAAEGPTEGPSKAAKSAVAAKEPSSGGSDEGKIEKPNGNNGRKTSAEAPSQTSLGEAAAKPIASKKKPVQKPVQSKKPDAKDKMKDDQEFSPPSESASLSSSSSSSLSSLCPPKKVPPNKKEASASNNQAKVEDADDGEWATVEVKPRGRRGKGGGKKPSPGASINNASNNNINNGMVNNVNGSNDNTNITTTNSNSNNNNGGRNHNSDHVGNHSGNHSGNHDGGGHHNHNGARRRNRRHNKGGDKQRNNHHHQHQQTKVVKDVITHILDAVDDEVARRGENAGKQGGIAKPAEDGKQRIGRLGNNEKRTVVNYKHQQHNKDARRKQYGGGVAGNASNTTPPPSIASNSSAKSLRDVLVGATTPPAAPKPNLAKAQSRPPNPAADKAKGGEGDRPEQPPKGSSRIKPGMSYKSAIQPDEPKPKPEPAPKSKPRPNAWAKPPAGIKAELKPDIVEKKIRLEPKPSVGKPPSEKPPVQGGGLLVPLVPLAAGDADDSPSSAVEAKEKKEAVEVVAADAVPAKSAGEDAACQTSDPGEDAAGEGAGEDDAANGNAPSPPLSTLLGPGTPCSASSSVASSLEAPHSAAGRFGVCGPSSSSAGGATEDDVGYHLLNVCGQLSEEINVFMSRRALALDVRRKEREAVLRALGDTLGKIWPGQCRVEMYGSCATQLDLPSSDLDLVVCGLDDVANHTSPVDQQVMSSMHDNSCNSFQEEEVVPQECVDSSTQHLGQEQPMTPEQHLVKKSLSSSTPEAVEGEPFSTPRQYTESIVEGDSGMIPDETMDGMLGVEYSPSASAVGGTEGYPPEYHESNQQEGAMSAMENFSPGYSYHSNQQDVVSAAAETFTPGYPVEEMGMEGYVHEYQPNGQEQFYYSPYDYTSTLSLNAQRVLRLASELELQPWAVQVKAIPTATVPVVKMLADPSRLPGLARTGGDDWMMQQHIAAQAGVAAGATPPLTISPDQISVPNQDSVSPSSHFLHPMAQWRGTDIKNGLQPVDITFEGPEHGGIGSTTYSLRVVQDAAKETGYPSESTPVVQVASVLKELLAQRRLNEPFSGGLSSYGLLMLLLAIMKDRKIIQEEMKKMEKQRQKVSAQDNREARISSKQRDHSSAAPSPAAQAVAGQSASPGVESSDKSSAAPSTTSKPTVSSSWASIAKKSNATARTESLSTITKSTNDSATAAKTAANYSQAVQKENKETSRNIEQGKAHPLAKKQVTDPPKGDSNAQPSETECLSAEQKQILPQSSNVALDGPAVLSQVTPSSEDDGKIATSSVPLGSNDVFEVLCSGELTSGKLLMHFLLFYGQHFDSQSTLIDINGTHHSEYGIVDLERLSPFVPRPPGGTIDPITGMFSVDPIVVYDPLEGAIDHNVSKRCYCWNNVRWVFAQCYMTVSSVVETSDTCTKSSSQSKHKRDANHSSSKPRGDGKPVSIKSSERAGSGPDVVTPILELLLSF